MYVHVRMSVYCQCLSEQALCIYPMSIIHTAWCGSVGTQVEGLYFRSDSVHMYTQSAQTIFLR